jgi:hypothetical protein
MCRAQAESRGREKHKGEGELCPTGAGDLDKGVGKGLDAARVLAEHDFADAPAALLEQQLAHLPYDVEPRPHHLGFHLTLLRLCSRPPLPFADFLRHICRLDGIHQHRRAS